MILVHSGNYFVVFFVALLISRQVTHALQRNNYLLNNRKCSGSINSNFLRDGECFISYEYKYLIQRHVTKRMSKKKPSDDSSRSLPIKTIMFGISWALFEFWLVTHSKDASKQVVTRNTVNALQQIESTRGSILQQTNTEINQLRMDASSYVEDFILTGEDL